MVKVEASKYETGYGVARKVARSLGEDRYQTFMDKARLVASMPKKHGILHDLDPVKVIAIAAEYGIQVTLK